jgi:hypothetical protein
MAITGSPNSSFQSLELLFDVMMVEFFSKRWGRICVTLLSLSVVGVSIIKPISPTVQSIVVPVITGLLGAAIGRVTTELRVKKSE